MSFDPINIEFLINAEEVKASSEKVKKSLMEIGYTAEEAENKINQKLSAALERNAFKDLPLLEQQGVKTQRVWNGLGYSINQLTRELPAFTLNAQTGFLAISNNLPILADEIARIKAKNDALVASGEKGVPVWKQVVSGFLSWQTLLSFSITLITIYGKEIGNLIKSMFQGAEAFDAAKARLQALNKAFEDTKYQNIIADIMELNSVMNLYKKGLIEKKIALEKYNEVLGDAAGKTDDINIAEKTLKDKTPAFIEAMMYRIAAMSAAAEAAALIAEKQKEITEDKDLLKKYEDLEKKAIKTGNTITSKDGKTTIQSDIVKTKINDIKEAETSVKNIITNYQKMVDDLLEKAAVAAKKAGLNLYGDDDPDKPKNTVSEYQNLLDKIAAIDAEYTRKSFTKDEEEIQALHDKFQRVRELVERFNKDPKNKATIIDLTAFNGLEKQATADLIFRQETEKLKEEITERKALYDEFEKYKKTFGEQAAKKEYASKIGEAETYYEYLKNLERKNATSFTAVANNTATGGQTERVNYINKLFAKETEVKQKEFNKQLELLIDYQQKRKILIENHQKLINELTEKGHQDKIAEAIKNHEEELDALDDANIKKFRSYKDLQRGIVGLSREQAKAVLQGAEALLNDKSLNISEDLRKQIEQAIAKLKASIRNGEFKDLQEYTDGLIGFGNALSNLGSDIDDEALQNAGRLLSGLGEGIEFMFKALQEGATNADILNATLFGLNAIFGIIASISNSAKRRREEQEKYYRSVIGLQHQYNLTLQEEQRLRTELNDNVFFANLEGKIRDGLNAIQTASLEYNKLIDTLIDRGRVQIRAFTGNSWIDKTFYDYFFQKASEYPDLILTAADGTKTLNSALAQSLLENNLLNEETKQILQNLLEWEEAIEKAKEQVKQVIQELTGSLGDDLRNTLVEAFVAGENAAIKMGDTVEQVLENVLSNFIFNQIFQQAFDELQKRMAASFDIGGDNNWVDDFAAFFSSASALTEDFNQAMEDAQAEAAALGFSIFQNANNNNALTGGIRRELTEQTGSELLGLFRGYYDLTRFNLEQMQAYIEAEKAHHSVTLEILAINTQIEINTRELVLQVIRSNKFLESIDDTTEAHFLFIQ